MSTNLNMKEIVALAKLAETLLPAVSPLVDELKASTAKLVTAKNVQGDAATEKSGVFGKVMHICEVIADATTETPQLREWAVEQTLGEFLTAEKDSAFATVKAYASTGKAVLVKLHTDAGMDFATLKEMSYGDIRATLNPPANRVASNIADEIAKQVKYIAKHGDKHGVNATDALNALRAQVLQSYNAVKSAKDANSAASKAAKELGAARQQGLTSSTKVETVAKAA